jgi:hypothetical protein
MLALERRRENRRRYYRLNKSRENEMARAWKRKHPDLVRGYTAAQRKRQRDSLAGRAKPIACAGWSGTQKAIHWDHCHKCKKFRGWIHGRLNRVLGLVHDDPKILRLLAEYLERHQCSI